MSDERLDVVQARQDAQSAAGRRRAGTSAQSRRDRVARSRARAQGLKEGAVEPDATEVPEEAEAELPEETPAADVDAVDVTEVVADEIEEIEVEETESAPLPDGAVLAPEDGSVPEGYEIKGNANSMKYHVPGGRYYDMTIGAVFFDTAEHAEAAGYEAPAADVEDEA
jgi:hypothetical protein